MRTFILSLLVLCFTATVSACSSSPASKEPPRILKADLDRLAGPVWRGTLTYLDFSSGQSTTIRSSMQLVRLPGPGPAWEIRFGYDDEPKADNASRIELSADGRTLDGETVVERTGLPGGGVRYITETAGTDNNRPALLRRVYLISDREVSIQKLVRVEGGEFFERHLYRWMR